MPRTSKRHWTKTQRGNWGGGHVVPPGSSILFQQLEKSDDRNVHFFFFFSFFTCWLQMKECSQWCGA